MAYSYHNIRTIRTKFLIDNETHGEENRFTNRIKYVTHRKSILLLGNNQYTSNVESGSSRIEINYCVELFFGIKVITMTSYRDSREKGKRMGPKDLRFKFRLRYLLVEFLFCHLKLLTFQREASLHLVMDQCVVH